MARRNLGLVFCALLVACSSPAPTPKASPPVGAYANGMVVAAQHLASEVGLRVLKDGGNAVDAAVAVGYALAVVDPCCGNIGGGGFMTLHLAGGNDVFLNFRERAPMASTRDTYLDAQGKVVPNLSLVGYRAAGVPGTVLGLDTALRRYGTMSRQRVMAPAIDLAAKGFTVDAGDAELLKGSSADFAKQPNVASIFLKDAKPYEVGGRLVQAKLAATLKLISDKGPDAFYKGPVADALVAASQANGGILSKQDLASYNVEETAPVRCTYRGYQVVSSPPPSSGGTTLCEILNVLGGYNMGGLGLHSTAAIHDSVEAMRRAYADRNTYLGDPDFVKNPLDRLLSKDYATKLRMAIVAGHATPSSEVKPGLGPLPEGSSTTHYSIVDSKGNAAAVTYTINALFGARVIAADTGFFLNDEMDDFTSKPGVPNLFGLVQGQTNSIAPGKRPLSSMSPTILLKNGHVFMVTGSPGGSRIITITLATIQNVLDYGMDAQKAVDTPRFHHQYLPDTIQIEQQALAPDVMDQLTAEGYKLSPQADWGSAQVITVDPDTGFMRGGTDRRTASGSIAAY